MSARRSAVLREKLSDVSGGLKLNLDESRYSQKKHTRIFHSPFRIRNLERGFCRPVVAFEMNRHWNRKLVIGAMNGKHSVDLESRVAGGGERSLSVIGME